MISIVVKQGFVWFLLSATLTNASCTMRECARDQYSRNFGGIPWGCETIPPWKADCVCPAVYRPVQCCVTEGYWLKLTGEFQAGNECDCMCRGGRKCETHTMHLKHSGDAVPQTVCTRDYVPVCCEKTEGGLETTSNSCECKGIGKEKYRGECRF